MNIFKHYESKESMKICSKTHQIAPLKFFSGKHARRPMVDKKVVSLGKSCIRP